MVVSDSAISWRVRARDDQWKCNFDVLYVVTLSEQGMLKATNYTDYVYTEDSKGNVVVPTKYNVRAMKLRENDKAAAMDIIIINDDTCAEKAKLLIYTAKGHYLLINTDEIPISAKDTIGLKFITPAEGDRCEGLGYYLPSYDTYVVVVTAKGCVKKVESQFLFESKKRNDSSYLTKVDDGDEVIYARGCNDDDILCVITKTNGETIYPISEIPTLGRSAKGKKLIPVPNGDCIINVCIDQPGP